MKIIIYCGIQVLLNETGKVISKECRQCKEIKTLVNFHKKNVRGIGGTWHICKQCRNKTTVLRNRPIEVVEICGSKIEMKQCSKCEKLKHLEEFRNSKYKGAIGNKVSICHQCEREWQRNYRDRNKEKVSASKKEVYKKNKLKYINRSSNYYRKNIETVKSRARHNYQKNKVEYKERVKEYVKENPRKVATWRMKHKTMKKHLPTNLTSEELENICYHYDYSCALSGTKENIEYDHFIPISIGHGGSYKGNIIPLTSTINCSKSNSNPFEWIERLENAPYKTKFENVVAYLATLNSMSIDEYRAFVIWCFDNPRTLDELKADSRTSIQLWKDSN